MIVVIGLVVAFVLLLIFARPGTRACRWRMNRALDTDEGSYWRCAACGAEARTDGPPPRDCRDMPSRPGR